MTSVSVVVCSFIPRGYELVAQLESVVDLAVVDDVETAVGGGHRHEAARLEIDDRQAAGGELDARRIELAVAIRPAMEDRVAHARGEPGLRITTVEDTTPAMPHTTRALSARDVRGVTHYLSRASGA